MYKSHLEASDRFVADGVDNRPTDLEPQVEHIYHDQSETQVLCKNKANCIPLSQHVSQTSSNCYAQVAVETCPSTEFHTDRLAPRCLAEPRTNRIVQTRREIKNQLQIKFRFLTQLALKIAMKPYERQDFCPAAKAHNDSHPRDAAQTQPEPAQIGRAHV